MIQLWEVHDNGALDDIVYVFLIIAIVGPIVQLLLSKAPRTKNRVF